jgi:hypothetical protein
MISHPKGKGSQAHRHTGMLAPGHTGTQTGQERAWLSEPGPHTHVVHARMVKTRAERKSSRCMKGKPTSRSGLARWPPAGQN